MARVSPGYLRPQHMRGEVAVSIEQDDVGGGVDRRMKKWIIVRLYCSTVANEFYGQIEVFALN